LLYRFILSLYLLRHNYQHSDVQEDSGTMLMVPKYTVMLFLASSHLCSVFLCVISYNICSQSFLHYYLQPEITLGF
jgi:hypothetical protein